VWNLYITLLSSIVDLGPEDGKNELGQKEWKSLVSKVREGEIWEMIVQVGYRGMEGSVDADVVYNLWVHPRVFWVGLCRMCLLMIALTIVRHCYSLTRRRRR
jgi:hypothetical protein